MVHISAHIFTDSIAKNKTDLVVETTNILIDWFKQYKFAGSADIEHLLVTRLVYCLIAGGYYQLALKMLKEVPIPKHEDKMWNKIILYLTSDNNRETLSTLGSETVEAIDAYLTSIFNTRDTFKKAYPLFTLNSF